MLSRQEEEAERQAVLENDLQVQRQAGTFFQHGVSQAAELSQGRFAAMGAPHVVGSAPAPRYPAAAAHQADPVPAEPPLGYSVDAMPIEPSTAAPPVSSSVEEPSPASTRCRAVA
jgi:hypothetical protein